MTLANTVTAFFTLCILSIAFKDNPAFRFAENAYVGLFAGYTILVNWFNYGKPTIFVSIIQKGKWSSVIPVIIGLLIYTRYFKPVAWVSRYTMGFLTGVGSAYVLTKNFKPMFVSQLIDTIRPLTGIPTSQLVNNLLLAVGVMGTMTYFLFTVERKGPVRAAGQVGRWFMMVAFGSAFGNTVMTRYARLLGRLQFLLGDWLGLLK